MKLLALSVDARLGPGATLDGGLPEPLRRQLLEDLASMRRAADAIRDSGVSDPEALRDHAAGASWRSLQARLSLDAPAIVRTLGDGWHRELAACLANDEAILNAASPPPESAPAPADAFTREIASIALPRPEPLGGRDEPQAADECAVLAHAECDLERRVAQALPSGWSLVRAAVRRRLEGGAGRASLRVGGRGSGLREAMLVATLPGLRADVQVRPDPHGAGAPSARDIARSLLGPHPGGGGGWVGEVAAVLWGVAEDLARRPWGEVRGRLLAGEPAPELLAEVARHLPALAAEADPTKSAARDRLPLVADAAPWDDVRRHLRGVTAALGPSSPAAPLLDVLRGRCPRPPTLDDLRLLVEVAEASNQAKGDAAVVRVALEILGRLPVPPPGGRASGRTPGGPEASAGAHGPRTTRVEIPLEQRGSIDDVAEDLLAVLQGAPTAPSAAAPSAVETRSRDLGVAAIAYLGACFAGRIRGDATVQAIRAFEPLIAALAETGRDADRLLSPLAHELAEASASALPPPADAMEAWLAFRDLAVAGRSRSWSASEIDGLLAIWPEGERRQGPGAAASWPLALAWLRGAPIPGPVRRAYLVETALTLLRRSSAPEDADRLGAWLRAHEADPTVRREVARGFLHRQSNDAGALDVSPLARACASTPGAIDPASASLLASVAALLRAGDEAMPPGCEARWLDAFARPGSGWRSGLAGCVLAGVLEAGAARRAGWDAVLDHFGPGDLDAETWDSCLDVAEGRLRRGGPSEGLGNALDRLAAWARGHGLPCGHREAAGGAAPGDLFARVAALRRSPDGSATVAGAVSRVEVAPAPSARPEGTGAIAPPGPSPRRGGLLACAAGLAIAGASCVFSYQAYREALSASVKLREVVLALSSGRPIKTPDTAADPRPAPRPTGGVLQATLEDDPAPGSTARILRLRRAGAEPVEMKLSLLEPAGAEPFLLGQTEVAREQYAFVTGAGEVPVAKRLLPVSGVTWDQAQAFCKAIEAALGREGTAVRLPREPEWRHAIRGRPDELLKGTRLVNDPDAGPCAVPAGPATPDGVFDLIGNVSEWLDDPPGESPVKRARGGSYLHPPGPAAVEAADGLPRGDAYPYVGFRIVIVPPPR